MRTGIGAAAAIARVTLVRLRRGRALWIGGGIAALPVLFGLVIARSSQPDDGADAALALVSLVLCVLPALFVASSLGEDIEDRTITYLWSRAVPRASVLLGKLLALAPVVIGMVVIAWLTAAVVITGDVPPPAGLLGLASGAATACALAAAMGTLVPRHGMALTICYLLFIDTLIGAMPVSLANIAITHHVRVASASGAAASFAWLAGMAALWLTLGLWRIRRLEA